MISETTARASYTANGSTADFAFLFTIYSKNDVEVLRNGTVQQLDSDYHVRADSGLFEALASSSLPAAGSIRFIDGLGVAEPPDSGDIITILRKQAAAQSSDYIPGQSFPAASVERDIDKLMMAIQQTRETLARALTFAKKSTLTNGVVDDPTEGYFARAKVGGGIDWAQVASAGEITIPVPVNEGGTGAENAADARTNLGAVGLTGDETIAGQKTLSDDLTVNGQITAEAITASGQVTVSVPDSRTNTVATPLIVDAPTSGTPAANIGTGVLFKTQSADEAPSDAMKLSAVNSDVGAGSEDTFFQIMLRTAGQALGIAYEFYRTSQFVALFTHANTANRVYALPDAAGTVVLNDNAATLSGKTLSGCDVTGAAPATPVANRLYADSLVKGFVKFQVNGTIDADLNVSSITDSGAGHWVVNWATPFDSANYVAIPALQGEMAGTSYDNVDDAGERLEIAGQTASTLTINNAAYMSTPARTLVDPSGTVRIHVLAVGVQ